MDDEHLNNTLDISHCIGNQNSTSLLSSNFCEKFAKEGIENISLDIFFERNPRRERQRNGSKKEEKQKVII